MSIVQHCLPQRALSTFAGWLANSTIPWLKNVLIRYFLWRYTVNMEEAVQPDPLQYPSFNAFFTRTLKAEARPIASGLQDLISPVDGYVGALGRIENATLIQAKGHTFTVDELLCCDEASYFQQGSFITLYLAPHNYHRVHMPFEGYLSQMIYIPGRLFSVDFKTVATVPRLFARNERVVTLFETAYGRMAVVFVGAMIVGSIETVWAGTVGGHSSTSGPQHWAHGSRIHFKVGEELGLFKLGSTVILLFEDPNLPWESVLTVGHPICMGEKIAGFKTLLNPLDPKA